MLVSGIKERRERYISSFFFFFFKTLKYQRETDRQKE